MQINDFYSDIFMHFRYKKANKSLIKRTKRQTSFVLDAFKKRPKTQSDFHS